jgi:hypothetical protein
MAFFNLATVQICLKKWRIKANESKSVHVTFTTLRETCHPVHINKVHLPQQDDFKYLGLHLDRRLTWRKHIFTKRKKLGITLINCIGYLDRSQNSQEATIFPYTNQSVSMEYNCGGQLPLQT